MPAAAPKPGLSGHFWTIGPNIRHRIWPLRGPKAEPWRVEADVPLSGRWRAEADASTAIVVVHGLGGSFDRHYCVRMAREAARLGWSCLRLALRGADRRGYDFYHAGLVDDLKAALSSPQIAGVGRVFVVGYSLGGQLVMRYAANPDSKVVAVAAICPPLDLSKGQIHLDERAPEIYRRHVLGGLNEIYAAVAKRRAVPTPVERMRRVRTIREWDSLSIVPRYGFRDVDDYYESQSAARVVDRIEIPALVVASQRDPMVSFGDVTTALLPAADTVRLRSTARGGHVGFPADLDLGAEGRRGLEQQCCALLERFVAEAAAPS